MLLFLMRKEYELLASDFRPYEEFTMKLKTLRSYITTNIKDDAEIDKVKSVLCMHINECIRLNHQCILLMNELSGRYSTYTNSLTLLQRVKRNVLRDNTLEDIRLDVDEFLQRESSVREENEYIRSYNLCSAADKMKDDTDNTVYIQSEEELNSITSHIHASHPLNVFSIQCGNGQNERYLKDSLALNTRNIITTYGLDEEVHGTKEAKRNMNKVILGKLKGCLISNNVFDIVYVNPRISIKTRMRYNKGLDISNEDYLLTSATKYLKPGGILIYTIPFYSMSPGIKLFLAKNFKDISVKKDASMSNNDRQYMKYITVMGIRNANSSYADIYAQLTALEYDDLPEIHFDKHYYIDLPEVEIKLFRGSVLDEDELDQILLNDGLYEDFYTDIKEMDMPEDSSPLLPFNIGQIGLILSSGSLDGVVEEDINTRHIIKGMTIKETDRSSETSVENGRSVTTSTEVIRNKVQITALGADGTIYNLT